MIHCEKEIKEEEIERIYRIEYMHTCNWVMGQDRDIWILELDPEKETAKRKLYYGEPLVPAYSRFDHNKRERIEEGSMIFRNNYTYDDYFEILYGLEIWKWADLKSEMQTIDGDIMDVAFFVKDDSDHDEIYRYQIIEDENAWKLTEIFDRFFDVMDPEDVERVFYDHEMMERCDRLLPGNIIQDQ